MKTTIVTAGAFVAGTFCGVLASMTLRHEIWPLAARVGLLRLYALAGLGLFLLVTLWYVALEKKMAATLPHPLAAVLASALRFLLIVLALGGAYLFALFFVAVR